MKQFYRYDVAWYYDSKEILTSGLLIASSFCEAMGKVEEAFDDIYNVKLVMVNDDELLDFEDLLCHLTETETRASSTLGPQLIEALSNLVEQNEEVE
jgi:hypothetical protein